MRKDRLLQLDLLKNIKRLKDILLLANHPFHGGMDHIFHDETVLFFASPHIQGIPLSEIIKENGYLQEGTVKFIAA